MILPVVVIVVIQILLCYLCYRQGMIAGYYKGLEDVYNTHSMWEVFVKDRENLPSWWNNYWKNEV